jgi:site-specific DNA-cytosine methylase
MDQEYDLSWVNAPSPTPQLAGGGMPDLSWAEESGSYSLGEYAQQAGSSLVSGLTSTFTGAVEGLGIAAEGLFGESSVDDWARETQASIQSAVPGVEGLGDSWTAKISSAFGSAFGYVGAGFATGGLGTVASGSVAVGRAAAMVSSGSLGALGTGASRYSEALQLGKSEEDAWKSYFVGLGIGSLEAMPVGLNRAAMRLAKANKASGGALKNITVGQVMLAEGLEEAGQEMLSEGLNQLSDYALSIKSAEEAFDLNQLLESGVLGFLPGSAIGGITAKSQIAASLAEARKEAETAEEAKVAEELKAQRGQLLAEQIGAVETQAKQAQELVAAGEAELARLEGRAPTTEAEAVVEGETAAPTAVPTGTPEEIATVKGQLALLRQNRDALATQLKAITEETTDEGKALLAGAYGEAQARAEAKGLGEQFRAAVTPGAERLLTTEEQAEWDEKKQKLGKREIFKKDYDGLKNSRLVVAANEAQQKAEKVLTDLGFKVEFLDPGNDNDSFKGLEDGTTVYLNARLSDEALLRRVARHEAFHGVFRSKDGQNLWKDTMQRLQQAAPNVWAAAQRKALGELATTTGSKEKLKALLSTPEGREQLLNEQGSSAVDIFSATMDALEANPELADEAMQADPTFFQQLYDWVKTKLNKLGFKFETLADADRRAIEKLPKLLYDTERGDVEVEASANERIAGAQVLLRLLAAAEAGTVAAASGRERQARMFASRTLGELEATRTKEELAKRLEEEQAARETAAYEDRRKKAVDAARARLGRIKTADEEWKVIEAIGRASTPAKQREALATLPGLPTDLRPEEVASYVQAATERFDANEAKKADEEAKRVAALEKQRKKETDAARKLATAQREQEKRKEEKYYAKLKELASDTPTGSAAGVINRIAATDGDQAVAEDAVRSFLGKEATDDEVVVAAQTARETAIRRAARLAEEKQRKAKEAQDAKDAKARQAAEREAKRAQERKDRLEVQAARAQAKADERQRKLDEKAAARQRREDEARAAEVRAQEEAEQQAALDAAEAERLATEQAEQEAQDAADRQRRRREKLPTVARGRFVPGQLRVGDIVNFNNRASKVVDASGSGFDQRIKVVPITNEEAALADVVEERGTKDWWNAIPWMGEPVAIDMTDKRLLSVIAKRSDTEVMTQDGKKALRKRYEADLARKEGDAPLFSVKGQAITPEMEAEYMAAAEAGDLATAQRMVDEAAWVAGYTLRGFHGTKSFFNQFKLSRIGNFGPGVYLSFDEADAREYARRVGGSKVLQVVIRATNPFRIKDALAAGDFFDRFSAESDAESVAKAQAAGYDAVLAENDVTTPFGTNKAQISVFDPSQVKLADPITYDDNGNIIPLSQRFNEQVDDIRFSVKGQAITPEMEAKYMAAVESGDMNTAQQMVDKAANVAGYTIGKVYHGMKQQLAGNKFDKKFLGSNTGAPSSKMGFFFAGNKETSQNREYVDTELSEDSGQSLGNYQYRVAQELAGAANLLAAYGWGSKQNRRDVPELYGYSDSGPIRKVDYIAELLAPNEVELLVQTDEVFSLLAGRAEDISYLFEEFIDEKKDENEIDETAYAKAMEFVYRLRTLSDKLNDTTPTQSLSGESQILEVYLRIKNPFVYDFKGERYREKRYSELVAQAAQNGNDGVILQNTYDGGPKDTIYVVFEPDQIKSADPVTYDNGNNIIPLSQRFQDTTDDIRFSVRAKVPAAVGFAGGGTFEIALSDVLDTQLAVEMQPDIAEAYNRNAQRPATVARIGDVNAEDFKGKVLAHFSPPCVDSSLLRSGQGVNKAEETERGREVANIIRVAQNPIVVIENVREYGKSEAYKLITDALTESGYTWDAHVYKAQDYGSPSKRQRLFVRAVKQGELPPRPEPTHSNKPTLFEAPYASWGDALADVIDTLPEFKGELPPYVLKALKSANIDPKAPSKAYYISGTQVHGLAPLSPFDKPSPGMVASGAETPRILMPDGRVLRVTPEAMKRLMGFGAEMQLPSDPKLAKRIVGNGIPKPLTRAVVLPLLESQGVLDTQGPMFSAKGKGGEKPGKPSKPKRVSAKAATSAKAALKEAQQRAAAAKLKRAKDALRKEVTPLTEQALKEGEGTSVGEAPGSAIAATTEEARALTRGVREYMRQIEYQILPTLKADDDARAFALAELENDYEGTKEALFEEIRNNGSVSEPWKQYAVMAIAAQEAENATTGRMTTDKFYAAYEAESYDAAIRRNASAQLRVRKDAVIAARKRNKAHVFAGTSSLRKAERALNKALEGGNKADVAKARKEVDKIRRDHAQAVVEYLDKKREEGYDVDDMFSYLAKGDLVTFSRLMRGLHGARTEADLRAGRVKSVWDAFIEARHASMLSGPGTHIANIAGNAAMMSLRTTRQLAEVLTNLVIRDRDSADFGDFKAYMTGWLRSLGRAMRNFVMAYRTDMPVFEAQLNADSTLEFAEQANAIPGLIGRILRFPSLTTLRAFDELFKTMAAHTEAGSLAYRQGRRDGLSGAGLESFIDYVLTDYNHPLWQESLERARTTVFQARSDELTRVLLQARNWLDNNPTTVPIGSFLLPYIKTPTQIIKVGLSMPIHPFVPMFKFAKQALGAGTYEKSERVPDAANAMVAVGMLVLAYSLLGDDDDDQPALTGAAPADYRERQLAERTAPPNSIRVGDTWYSYNRVEPFATSMSALADMVKATQIALNEDVPERYNKALATLMNNAVGQLEDKTFLRTLGDVSKMFRDRENVNAAKMTRDLFISPMMPNLVRQLASAGDPYMRDVSVREYEDASEWDAMYQKLTYQVYPSKDNPDAPPIKHDLWGRPVERQGGSYMARAFSPAKQTLETEDINKLDQLIVRFNDKVEEGTFGGAVDKYLPRAPEYRIRRGDQEFLLSDDEYSRLTRDAGQLAQKRLQYRRLNYEDPTERDIEIIRDALSKARKTTIDRILRDRRMQPTQTGN